MMVTNNTTNTATATIIAALLLPPHSPHRHKIVKQHQVGINHQSWGWLLVSSNTTNHVMVVIKKIAKTMSIFVLLVHPDQPKAPGAPPIPKKPGAPPIPKKPDEAGSATSAACVLRRPSSIEFWRAVGTPQVRSRGDACMSEPSI